MISAPGTLDLQDVPAPLGDCRIRVSLAGICGTDLQLLDGYAGFRGIPGHEFVGVVEGVSRDEDRKWLGRRVVGEINIGCGHCHWCASGVKEHCGERRVLGIRGHDGAFAEFVTLPAANLHAIPDHVGDRMAVFVEPIAAACRILEQVDIGEGTSVAVLGDGRLGLLIGQVLQTRSSRIMLFGRHSEKLEIARALGLSCIDTRDAGASSDGGSRSPLPPPSPRLRRGLAEALRAEADTTHRFDVVVDATGRPEGLTRALELVHPRGTVVMKSTFHGEAPVATWPAVVNEVLLVGSRCGPFARAIELLSSGSIRTDPLISSVMRFEDHGAAFAAARSSLKVLFAPGS